MCKEAGGSGAGLYGKCRRKKRVVSVVVEVEFWVWGYKKCGSGSDCLKKIYVLGVVMI